MKTELKNTSTHIFSDLEDDSNIIDDILVNQSDEITEVVKCTPVLSANTTFRFRPINHKWQKVHCKLLGLIYVYNDYFKTNKNSVLHPPVECFNIVGDGNCFFRCISLCVTGTQVQHQEIRKIITDYMHNN